MGTVRVDRAAAAGPLGHKCGFVREDLRSGRRCRSATAGPASRVAERVPHALAAFFLRPCPADLRSGAAERKKTPATANEPNAGVLRHELGHACCFARRCGSC